MIVYSVYHGIEAHSYNRPSTDNGGSLRVWSKAMDPYRVGRYGFGGLVLWLTKKFAHGKIGFA